MKTFQKSASLFLFFALIFSACAKNGDEKLAAEVVERYHRLYNEQNYEEIFNNAHDEAKRTKSKEALGLALAQAFEKYGKYVGSELVYSKVQPVSATEKQVEFAFKSKFEKGTRNETFLVITNDRNGALYAIGELTDEELEKLKTQ
jgi:3-deoxy-D-manno-octulosonic acid (KDO) 8-phosphate synthase